MMQIFARATRVVGGAAALMVLGAGSVHAQTRPAPRMGPIPAETMTEAQAKAAKEVERNGAVPAYLWAPLRNPGLARPTQTIGEYLNREGKLAPKLTQLAILYVSKRLMYNGSWIEHVGMAQRAGLRDEIVSAIAAGQRPPGMDQDEQLVYDMCAELDATMTISDTTYARALARLGEAGIVDTVAIYGFYSYLGLLNNATRLPAGTPPAFRPAGP